MGKQLLLLALLSLSSFFFVINKPTQKDGSVLSENVTGAASQPSATPTPRILQNIPPTKTLHNDYHIIQTFNNCGPASLSMALSYFGIQKTQHELGVELRPYQHPTGDNDDKSVTLEELAKKAEEFELLAYHRPNGDIELLKLFIAHDLPVITRTWLHVNEDIGHYRVVKGYDEATQAIIQDDSFEGANLSFTYNDFNSMWSKFDFEYLVLVPQDKQRIAEAIIGKNVDEQHAWQQAVRRNEEILRQDPTDIYSRFNLSVAYYHTKDYQKSIEAFEQVESQLPFRTLWYQIEPILAYYELGNYDRVFAITDSIFNNYNRAFSELYILRGKIYQKQGYDELASQEFEKAVFYNHNLKEAQELLQGLSVNGER